MTKQELIRSAEQLKQPSAETAAEYQRKAELLSIRLNSLMSTNPDLDKIIGPGNLAMMQDNHRNHAQFIASLLTAYNPQVLVETVLWVFRAYRSHGFQTSYWPIQLKTWVDILRGELSDAAFVEIYPYYQWMIRHQESFILLSEAIGDSPEPEH
jgi:hypothetical protein